MQEYQVVAKQKTYSITYCQEFCITKKINEVFHDEKIMLTQKIDASSHIDKWEII